jgi:hypothetical protein
VRLARRARGTHAMMTLSSGMVGGGEKTGRPGNARSRKGERRSERMCGKGSASLRTRVPLARHFFSFPLARSSQPPVAAPAPPAALCRLSATRPRPPTRSAAFRSTASSSSTFSSHESPHPPPQFPPLQTPSKNMKVYVESQGVQIPILVRPGDFIASLKRRYSGELRRPLLLLLCPSRSTL